MPESILIKGQSINRGKVNNTETELLVDDKGRLTLSEEMLLNLGINADTKLYAHQTKEGLLIKRADPAFSKVYIEPTNGCLFLLRVKEDTADL